MVRPGQQIPASTINHLSDFARGFVNGQPANSDNTGGSGFPIQRPAAMPEIEWMVAKVSTTATTASQGKWAWKEQIWDPTATPQAWKDLAGGRTDVTESCGATEINGGSFAGVVWLARMVNGDTLLFAFARPPALFMVTLAWNAGSDGNTTTAVSWTYDVTDAISGVSYATAASPEGNRWKAAGVMKATRGLGWFVDGEFHFVALDEIPAPQLRAC